MGLVLPEYQHELFQSVQGLAIARGTIDESRRSALIDLSDREEPERGLSGEGFDSVRLDVPIILPEEPVDAGELELVRSSEVVESYNLFHPANKNPSSILFKYYTRVVRGLLRDELLLDGEVDGYPALSEQGNLALTGLVKSLLE